MEEWITIAQFDNPTKGYLLKALLEAERISCFLKDENMSNLIPVVTGGVKVQVPFRDSFRALEIYLEFTSDEDRMMI